jgi:hypothetical protein
MCPVAQARLVLVQTYLFLAEVARLAGGGMTTSPSSDAPSAGGESAVGNAKDPDRD